jgi:hypothetical protein
LVLFYYNQNYTLLKIPCIFDKTFPRRLSGMSSLISEEEELLDEICRKHNIDSRYLKELFRIEKEYADKNMSKRRGVFDRISDLVMDWVEQEEERRSIL